MARQGLCARPKRRSKGLTSQNSSHAAPGDLLKRDFSAEGINQKQFGDFKEVATLEGPVFLATVEDLYSRPMVGFATSDDYPTAELAKAATNTAVAPASSPPDTSIIEVLRRPVESGQYTAGALAKACQRLGIARSTRRTGNALDISGWNIHDTKSIDEPRLLSTVRHMPECAQVTELRTPPWTEETQNPYDS